MRTEIERWVLIALLGFGYLSQVPGLARQGTIGLPALVIGLLITLLLVLLLKRSSAGAALLIAGLAALALVMRLVGHFFVEPHLAHLAHGAPLSDLQIAVSVAGSMLVAFIAMDLWSAWKKKANKSPETNALSGQ